MAKQQNGTGKDGNVEVAVSEEIEDGIYPNPFVNFVSVYWRTLVLLLWPIILSPVIIYNNDAIYNCLYVVGLMAMFWVTEALPLAVTAFIPVALFPLMGILSSADTTMCYLNDTTMMFLGSMIIALALENSGLQIRVAYLIIRMVGCTHRRLTLGLLLVTVFISMWISNTAAAAMMVPIIQTVLIELENQGISPMFVNDDTETQENGEPVKRPTRITITYYLIAAYGATIGGTGTIVGTGTNLTFKGLFEARFPNADGLSFASWMLYAVPPMIISALLIWLWLQVLYMGMFRPNSKDARAIEIGEDGVKIAENIIDQKYKDLGPLSWHECSVATLFILVVLLWFFRNPGFITGWPEYITDMSVKDSTAAFVVSILMFIIPTDLHFLSAFNKDPSKRPTNPSPGLISWKLIQTKMHWGLLFVIGGGFAISTASTATGLSAMLGNSLSGLSALPPVLILFVVCLIIELITELTSNVAMANILLPVVAELAVTLRLHPLYLMLPATFCCSFSFHLPGGTPANAIASAAGRIKTKDLVIAGIGPTLITLAVLTITFPTWGNLIYNLDEFPSWAES